MKNSQKIVSLGNFCLPAHSIKMMGLKTESYPLDWLISHNDFIIDAIKDDFKKLLDKSYYGDHRFPGKRKASHSIYGDLTFMHRDPRSKEDYDYFVRCVNRWKSLYSYEGTVKFIQVLHPPKTYTKLTKEQFNAKALNDANILKDLISKRIKNSKFLFVMLHTESAVERTIRLEEGIWRFETKCKDDGLRLLDASSNDRLNDIFKNYIKV